MRISVIILNYNGARWIKPCLDSLRQQTIFDQIEVIVADNQSQDGSDTLAETLLRSWPPERGRLLQNGGNYGYCKGNNLGTIPARGEWLLFLNNDTWLEPNCLEQLLTEAEKLGVTAATPLVQDYDSNHFQSLGARGFDLFGFPTARTIFTHPEPVLMPEGCSYLIRRHAFEKLGGFDETFFMYADELDLSWRVWIAGGTCYGIPSAILHHRGAAQVNHAGDEKIVELRTSDTKRFYANRNTLLVLLKQSTFCFAPIILLQIAWLVAEGLAGVYLLHRFSFFKHTVWDALLDCFRQRHHLSAERKRLRPLRKHSSLWMLRFFRLRLNRWDEFQRIRHLGLPKVTK